MKITQAEALTILANIHFSESEGVGTDEDLILAERILKEFPELPDGSMRRILDEVTPFMTDEHGNGVPNIQKLTRIQLAHEQSNRHSRESQG